jgi:hypothetical protein
MLVLGSWVVSIAVALPQQSLRRENIDYAPVVPADLLVDRARLMTLPTSGPAWDNIVHWSQETAPLELSFNDSNHDVIALACALRGVRRASSCTRLKARNYIAVAAFSTAVFNDPLARSLSVGRNVPSYIFAADLLDLEHVRRRSTRCSARGSCTSRRRCGPTTGGRCARPMKCGPTTGGSCAAPRASPSTCTCATTRRSRTSSSPSASSTAGWERPSVERVRVRRRPAARQQLAAVGGSRALPRHRGRRRDAGRRPSRGRWSHATISAAWAISSA